MKYCKHCREVIDRKAKICPNCHQKQSMSTGKIILIVFLVLFVFIPIIVGVSDKSDTPTSDKKTNGQKEEKKKTFTQDEVVTYQGVNYTVTRVEKSQGSTYDKPDEGKEFVIVHILIENKTEEKISYNTFDWKMQNSNGQEDSTTFTTVDNDTSLSSGDLIASGKKEGTLVFEQPINDSGLMLNYYGNLLSDKLAFQIKIN